ncbi:MAG: hypothetical protein KKB03_02985 [Nanoarchaeota archaeon]|nr:hypothetical protein [Nanoarchaeota archaeon]MBU1135022.1 hypothetical protein [Nanoarchaeota archaeon]MBU2520180.1 hypothetical protein [Nanoarchaeota archaeon]
MGKTKAPNKKIVKKIKKILADNPQGLWIREIARRSGISKSCIHVYLNEYMDNDVKEIVSIPGLVKLYKLKK